MKRRALIEKVAASKYNFDNDEFVRAQREQMVQNFLSAFELYGMLPPCRNQQCAMGWKNYAMEHVCDHSWEPENETK